jgi:hypothetical protein
MPGVYFGPHGENNSTYANGGNANVGRWPLGHILITPDKREYRFVLNDGTVEVAANLYQSVAPVGDHTNIAADVVRAIGATAISATLGATAAAIDIYAEGIVHINDAVGEGYAYRIKRATAAGGAHAAVDASGIITVNLEAGETVQVALTTASEASFTRNRFHSVLIHASPPTAGLAGVSPGVAAANRYYWSQTKGFAPVLADGTLLAGLPVQASITTDGAVENRKVRARSGGTTVAGVVPTTMSYLRLVDQDGTTTNFLVPATVSTAVTANYDISGPIATNAPVVGICVKANANTEQALVDLMLP